MKKWLAIMATSAILGSGFAQDQFDNQIAFSRAPDKKQPGQNGMDKTKVFFGYKLFLTQPGESHNRNTYATLTDANDNTTNLNSNYGWDFGHFATLGVQLKDSLFKLYVEGWYFRNKKDKLTTAPDGSTLAIGPAFYAPLGITPTAVATASRSNLYLFDLLLSYAAYRKGNFFFIPYAGPRYIQATHKVQAVFTGGTATESYLDSLKAEAYGAVLGLKLKYLFTNRFYAFGDFRYSLVFTRSTLLNAKADTNSTLGINFSTGEVYELAYGAGVLLVDRSNWNLSLDAMYKLFRWTDSDIHYQALGAGVSVGF